MFSLQSSKYDLQTLHILHHRKESRQTTVLSETLVVNIENIQSLHLDLAPSSVKLICRHLFQDSVPE